MNAWMFLEDGLALMPIVAVALVVAFFDPIKEFKLSLFSFLKPKSAIYVVNESTVVTDSEVRLWCQAVQLQLKRDVAPVWKAATKTVRFLNSAAKAPANSWVIAVLDDADQAGDLGYHTVDERGRVYGRVFAKTALDYGVTPSTTFSHEVLETWGDPGVNKVVKNPKQTWSAPVELCDAVEGDSYLIYGIAVSNFLFPAWFGAKDDTGLDHMGTTPGPFQVALNGYMVREFPDGTSDQVFGEMYNVDYGSAKYHDLGRTARRK